MKTLPISLAFLFLTSIAIAQTAPEAPAADAAAPVVAEAPAAPAAVAAEAPAVAAAPEVVISEERKALIMKFIDTFGTRQAMKDNLAAMFESMPPEDPQTQKLKDGVNVEDIIARLIPLYGAKFSDEELNAFITFYSSPAGQKLLKEIPQIMQESVDVTATYFDEKFPEMNAEDTNVTE